MRLAIVSSFLTGRESGLTGHEGGLEYSYARAFRALGHHVEQVRDTSPEPFRLPKSLSRIEACARRRLYEEHLCQQVLAANVHFALVIKGRGVTARIVKRWRKAGLRVANLMPDNPFEAAAIGLGAPGLLAQYHAVDVVLVHDRIAVGQLRERGVRSEFIAFARDPTLHCVDLSEPRGESDYQIVFVGNPDSERIRYLRAISDLGLAVFGYWEWAQLEPDDPLKRCIRPGVKYGATMVAAMRSAKISINVLRRSQKTAHNMRTFEIPGCGVCCLSEFSIGVSEFLREGKEIRSFRSPEDLRQVAIRLLESPATIDALAASGYERVVNETYQKRAAELLQIFR